GVAGQGSRGIVRCADVEDAGVRRGSQHGLYVMSVGFRQRYVDHACPGILGGVRSRLVSGVGGHETCLGRSEGHDGIVQWFARSWENSDMIVWHALLLGEELDHLRGQVKSVTAALRRNGQNRISGSAAWPERVFVCI